MGKCILMVLSQLQSPPAEDAVNANIFGGLSSHTEGLISSGCNALAVILTWFFPALQVEEEVPLFPAPALRLLSSPSHSPLCPAVCTAVC